MPSPIVLIVDDQATMRSVLVAALTPLGYRLLEASDGETAIAMAGEFTPDVILLDVMMPGVTGFDVLRRLRDNPSTREIPVVMVTALGDKQSRAEALSAGADDILSKPTDLTELRLRVQTICRLNRYRLLVDQRSSVAALVEGSSIGTLVCDQQGSPVFANEYARRVFRLDVRQSDAGVATLAPLDPATHAQVTEAAQRALQLDAPVQVPAQGVAASGGVRELVVTPTRWSGLPAIRVDAIEARRPSVLEDQLRHRERLASVGQLTASVAHELTSVLTIIDLTAQRIEANATPEAAEASRGKIRAAVSRGASLLMQLQRSARPSSSKVRGVPFAQIRDETLPGLQTLLLDAVDIRVSGDADLSVPLTRADLEQVLINLVSNARDAGADAVDVQLRRTETGVELSVVDNGRGLDPSIVSRIGTAFASTRAEKGHGLGVWTIRRILEDAGAALRYRAVEAGGTAAICDFPVLESQSHSALR